MATYIMLGKYSLDSLARISPERSREAAAMIKQNAGELKAAYALLGGTDLVVIVDLPDTERAIRTSIGLSRLLGASFNTMPAVTAEEFDRLVTD